MLFNKKENKLTPEIVGLIAENGICSLKRKAAITRALLDGGLDEVNAVKKMKTAIIAGPGLQEVESLVARYFPFIDKAKECQPSLWLKLKTLGSETVDIFDGWLAGSPAFAYRSSENHQSVSFHKELGRKSVHLEVIRRDERLADLRVSLIDNSSRDQTTFEVELIKDGNCLESVSMKTASVASISSIETGDYELRLSDNKGELTSLRIRME